MPNSSEEQIVIKLIEVSKSFIKENIKKDYMIIPKNLKEYIELQIEPWCKEAYKSKHNMKEKIDYVITKDELPEKVKKKLKMQNINVKDTYRISPVFLIIQGLLTYICYGVMDYLNFTKLNKDYL